MLRSLSGGSNQQNEVCVIYAIVTYFIACWIDLWTVKWMNDSEKDLEISLLRQQLRIVERRQERGPHIARWQKVPLAILVNRLRGQGQQAKEKLAGTVLLFRPATVINWHRELVRRKWTYKQERRPGRPRSDPKLEYWIVRLAKENPGQGFEKLEGELKKLGFSVCSNTVKNVLRSHRIPPAPERNQHGLSWRTFLAHYKDQMLACDFFTVETAWLKTIYALFFIELGTRRIHFAGCTANPSGNWVTQQARQILWKLDERETRIRFLIHDRDKKFSQSFDTVFRSEGIRLLRTPFKAPNAIAFAERWVKSVPEERL